MITDTVIHCDVMTLDELITALNETRSGGAEGTAEVLINDLNSSKFLKVVDLDYVVSTVLIVVDSDDDKDQYVLRI